MVTNGVEASIPSSIVLSPDTQAKMLQSISFENWEKLIAARNTFMSSGAIEKQTSIMNKYVVSSWQSCQQAHMNPDEVLFLRKADQEKYRHSVSQNRRLIDIANVCFDALASTPFFAQDSCFYLADNNNILLLFRGHEISAWQNQKITPGFEASGIKGTCAHTIVNETHQPVFLFGPEHYYEMFFESNIAAVPIFDESKKLIATILASRHIRNYNPETISFLLNTCASAFYQVKLVAKIIENELKNKTYKICTNNQVDGTENYLRKRTLENAQQTDFSSIVGTSEELSKTIEKAKAFARLSENILIVGESGTGKELFARAIHSVSRPDGPFIALNCAAIPQSLIESELFGYESGSFTGATSKGKTGKIELAEGGTLFLDEIGDMPLELQAVLLRVLEDKQIMRIGGNSYKKIDVRFIAATNQNLLKLIREGKFRKDLYYRISILNLHIPPLRKRRQDIDLLVDFFVKKHCEDNHLPIPKITKDSRELLRSYSWPGNVRQLRSTLISAICLSSNGYILPEDLLSFLSESPDSSPVESDIKDLKTMADFERLAIIKTMREQNNNITRASEVLRISKSTLYRKLREYNLTP